MAITVKHSKTSLIADAGDATLVQPSDWNADHTLTGTIPVANGGTGASTLTGYVKGSGTANMTAASTIPNTDVTGLGTASTKDAGSALGVATLDAGGTVPLSQIPASIQGGVSYQGTWNASTNTPTLSNGVGTKGYYYVVSVAGSTNLDGITAWNVGDWAIFNGTVWQKVDNTDAVTSVNGYTGTVVLTQTDISGTVPTSRTITAGTGLTGGGDLSANRTLAIDSTVATLTGTQTLTNKTITAPKIDLINDTNGNEILGLSPTTSAVDYLTVKNGIGVGVPLHVYADGTSASIGLHIQPKGTGLVTISDGTDFNKGIRFRSSGSAASAITLLDAVATAGRVVTLPDATTTLVGRDTTDTLTNKSISGSTNTLSNIGNASLTNSAITINGTSTSLGGSISVGTVTSVTGTSPVVSSGGNTPAISMPAATISVDGYLTSTDWNTFNSKGSGTVTSVSATSPVTSSGGATPNIAMPAATTSVSGYLTSTDWTTFNNKGSGSVTAVSVVSANGFTGTSSGGATPALTLTTSITGMLKGNGAAISAGTAGTDFVAPATATSFTAQQYFGNVALTDAATIAWAANTAQVATFTFVSSNRTMGAPTGLVSGAYYGLAVIQNSGSNTLTWNSVFKWAGGTAPTLSTAASAKDYFVFRTDGTNLYEQGRSLGVA
jgi:hypothetical protein